jgi:capsular exopolysaccharide synthesis family protein
VREPANELRQIFRVLYQRRWLAIAVCLLTIVMAGAYVYFATPVYEARVKLLIQPESPNVTSFKDVIEEDAAKLDYYQTQLGILRSRTMARRTLDALDLWQHPEIGGPERPSLMSRLRSFGRRSANAADDPAAAQSAAIDRFLGMLTIQYRPDARLLDIGFRSPDRDLVAKLADGFAQNYIKYNLESKLQAAKDAADWLNVRLAEQRKQVETSELALQHYRERNADVSLSERQNITVERLAEMSNAATRARMERLQAEAEYAQLKAVQDDPASLESRATVLATSAVPQLRAELATLQREQATLAVRVGPRHPDMMRLQAAIDRVNGQIRAEVGRLAETLNDRVAVARAKERSLADALEGQKRQALDLNRKTIEYSVLQREATSSRQVFESLLQRANETQVASEMNVTNVRIVDRAETPRSAVWPPRLIILVLGLLAGLPMGAGAALAAEYLDDRIKTPDDLRTKLGLNFFGFAPELPRAVSAGSLGMAAASPPSYLTESFRALRAQILVLPGASGSNSLLVTSTQPDEGKTTVVTNLAVALALVGRRVLLIDGDMRRSQIHRMFNQVSAPGLAAVLEGDVGIREAIRPTNVPGLSILPAGRPSSSPGDLLQLTSLRASLTQVEDEYDWVLIDSPPVMVAADAVALAQTVSTVLLVVGHHMTKAREARMVLEQLAASGTPVAGAILSRAGTADMSERYSKYSDEYESEAV